MTKIVTNPTVVVKRLANALPSAFNGPLTYQVYTINGVKIPPNREVYWDGSQYFYRKAGSSDKPARYCVTWDKNQQITLNHVCYVVNKNIKVQVHGDNLPGQTVVLTVGNLYRLRNNVKVTIIAKIESGELCSSTQYVGVYNYNGDLATIRLSPIGKVLSHGGDLNYDVTERWTKKTVWIVLYNTADLSGSVVSSQSFDTEAKANEFKKTVYCVKVLKEEV